MKTRFLRRKPSSPAFTLIETVLSLGVVAFAMLPVIGLVPCGLGVLRDAISCTAQSQIAQGLSNEILLTDYSLLLDKYNQAQYTYYNEEGAPLATSADPAKQYAAKVELSDVSATTGSSVSPVTSKCVTIRITDIAHPLQSRTYSLVIPKG